LSLLFLPIKIKTKKIKTQRKSSSSSCSKKIVETFFNGSNFGSAGATRYILDHCDNYYRLKLVAPLFYQYLLGA